VDYLEAEIHKLDIEDNYFETYAPIPFQAGVQDYALPSNIYANKILRIVWRKNAEIFEIRRLTKLDRYTDIAVMEMFRNNGVPYYYQILNNSPVIGPRIHIVPAMVDSVAVYNTTANRAQNAVSFTVASATGIAAGQFVSGVGIEPGTRVVSVVGTTVTISEKVQVTVSAGAISFSDQDALMYYIREANRITGDTSIVDAFEFDEFVVQHMIVSCLGKEVGNPRLPLEQARLADLQQQMISTLTEMVPDQRNEIEPDFSFEKEMS